MTGVCGEPDHEITDNDLTIVSSTPSEHFIEKLDKICDTSGSETFSKTEVVSVFYISLLLHFFYTVILQMVYKHQMITFLFNI